MPWARRRIEDALAISPDAATLRRDLPRENPISALLVKFEWNNGTTSNRTESILDAIDLIEVKYNGGEIALSLEAVDLFKWNHLYYRRQPPWSRDQRASASQFVTFLIPFGRFVGDPLFWFPANRVRDFKLEITYSPTIAVTEWATATGSLEVVGIVHEGGDPSSQHLGFLKTATYREFTSAASGVEPVLLPTGVSIRELLVFAFEAAIEDGVDITDVVVRKTLGGASVFEANWLDLQEENQAMFGIAAGEAGILMASNADTQDLYQARLKAVELLGTLVGTIGTDDQPNYKVTTIAGSRITVDAYLVEGTATYTANAADTTDRAVRYMAEGVGIGHTVIIPATYDDDPGKYWQFGAQATPVAELTQGAAGATVRVSGQEIARV